MWTTCVAAEKVLISMSSEDEKNFNQRLSELQERERTIIKKMNTAMRAGASSTILEHMQFMLEENRALQFELKVIRKEQDDDDFDDFLSIG